ncbi:MAG: ATP-dependent helicase [Candidatus Glassbacteria bacterium]|nr:ATP-dependent helicase [Candidatus Glassbacteria bacterium]
MNLNKEQLAAVNSDSDRILTVAGAGTGKTHVLTNRIQRLVESGESPNTMLALTFTRKAAGEMRDRLGKMLTPAKAGKMRIGTFHAIALQVVKDWGDRLGYKPNLSIYDQVDQRDVIESIIKDFGEKVSVGLVLEVMQHEAERKTPAHPKRLEVLHILHQYKNILRRYNALDYQGLLDTALKLMIEFPEVILHYRRLWRLVFVDEYQDTDIVQWDFLQILSPDKLFVVGDYRQSIYGWRGARPDLLMKYADIATRFDLVKNYRSLPGIVYFANNIVSSALYGEPLIPTRKSPRKVHVHTGAFADLLHEGIYIVETIKELVDHHDYRYADIAVMARKNGQLKNFAQWLKDSRYDEDVPFVRIGSKLDFWKSEPVRVCALALRLINNPFDNRTLYSILRTLNIEVPDLKRLEWMANKAGQPMFTFLPEDNPVRRGCAYACNSKVGDYPASVVFKIFTRHCDIKGHYSESKRTTKAGLVAKFAEILDYSLIPWTLQSFLEWHAFREIEDELSEEETGDTVRLMTVHAAKGLEFPVVIVMGCTDEDFPAMKGDEQEERRLFYVAATRPREGLYVTCPLMNEWGGLNRPSRFMTTSKKGPKRNV